MKRLWVTLVQLLIQDTDVSLTKSSSMRKSNISFFCLKKVAVAVNGKKKENIVWRNAVLNAIWKPKPRISHL